MTYETVFDISQEGFKSVWFPASGLIFVAVGVLLLLGPYLTRRFNLKSPPFFLAKRKLFDWIYFIFALYLTASSFHNCYSEYRDAITDFQTGLYSVVEGRVTDFVPLADDGRGYEEFSVAGQHFFYSDYSVTAGFNNTVPHGGPIREGLYVRIAHSGNLILRLEIAR